MLLKDLLANYFTRSKKNLGTGFFIVVGKDGYRAAISYNELFNRTDQSEFLIIDNEKEDNGRFKIIYPYDFFADRAVKAVSEIRYFEK